MKKFISFLLAASMMSASVASINVCAAGESKNTNNDLVLFGDSIAAGYGLSSSEYNYGQLCADYLGGNVDNFAHKGDTSKDMLEVIKNLNDSEKKKVKDAEYIVISIGGNDMMRHASKEFLAYAVEKKFLTDGKTADDIPENPGISALLELIDLNKIKAYIMKDGKIDYNRAGDIPIKRICGEIGLPGTIDEPCVISTDIIPNINSAISELRSINSSAQIILQTIYQPLQLEPSYIQNRFGNSAGYKDLLDILSMNFHKVLDTFRETLNSNAEKADNVKVADVFYEFTATETGEYNKNDPGHSYYFTNIQLSGNQKDFHPNQKGHLAIAAAILDTIGDLHFGNNTYTNLFSKLKDKNNYPEVALETYKKVAGTLYGDVNLDNRYTTADATLALREVGALANPTAPKSILTKLQQKAADIDKNGRWTTADATKILSYTAYLSSLNNGQEPVSIEEYWAKRK